MAAADTVPGRPEPDGDTLAFVESPVQLLNVLEWAHARALTPREDPGAHPDPQGPPGGAPRPGGRGPRIVVLPPTDSMTRGQLRRMAELARGEGCEVRWEDARGDVRGPLRAVRSLTGPLRRAGRVVVGDPFSRYAQLLLTLTRPTCQVVVVDDGTATMEFVAQLASGAPLVRWHRVGTGGLRGAVFAPLAARARC